MNKLRHELQKDHNIIEQVVRGMQAAADLLDNNRQLEPHVLSDFVQFLKVFAGQCHIRKEEQYLFPLLATKGNARANQEIAALATDHRIAAQLVTELGELAAGYSRDPSIVPKHLTIVFRSLAKLYSDRIWVEDYLLFPIVQQMSEREQRLLQSDFQGVETDIGTDVHAAFEALANQLEALVEYRNSDDCPVSSPAA